MRKNFYITTPIYYVNDNPHIGHAYTSVISDVIARSRRLYGEDVILLTGTDEHGLKVEKSALKNNTSPQDFVDKISQSFKDLMLSLNISNDGFIRTTENYHKISVKAFWNKLVETNNIYLGSYSGWYSTADEAFFATEELNNGLTPTKNTVEWIEEPSYFFKLSNWENKLLKFYSDNPNFIKPISRYNEVIQFVKSGLRDLSISRSSFNWGIKVPNDPNHIIYVWLDALTNYISFVGYPNKLNSYWPADLHIIGKDILIFHAVYWVAFLMAANLDIPKQIIAHGWLTNKNDKISKSLGNVINPNELIKEFGVDALRYYLIREITLGGDANYSREHLINRMNTELSNKIGNLLQRVLVFLYKYNKKLFPKINNSTIYNTQLIKKAENIKNENYLLIQNYEINKILQNIVLLSEETNFFIEDKAPWKLKNQNFNETLIVLGSALESIRYIAIMLQPFIPSSASKMLDQLKIPITERSFKNLNKNFTIQTDEEIDKPEIIFPKYDKSF